MHSLFLEYFINLYMFRAYIGPSSGGIARVEPDGTRAETRFRLSPKRMSPFKSVGASVQSTAGSRGVRISFSNAGYTMFSGGVRVLATHSIRQFPLHFPSRASPCAIRFRTSSTTVCIQQLVFIICFRCLSVVPVGLELQSNKHNRQSSKKNNKYQLLHTHGCAS